MTNDDKAEIIEIINLYAFALDTHQWDLFDRVFTEDVVAVFVPAGSGWNGLNIFKASFAEFHAKLDSHQHTMMGHLVVVDGDTAHAFSYGNWLLIRESAEGGPTWTGTGWYDDDLVRTEQGWTGNPNVPEQHNEHNPDMNVKVLHSFAEAGDLSFLKALQGK
jgi:ketosteroid isomerase-like protein